MTAAMSSQTSDKLTDELKQAYNAVLLQVFKDLEAEQRAELYYYFTARISRETLHILRSLEDAEKVSWLDVSSLKKALTAISRLDLERKLTVYEIKRNLTILLNFYGKMRSELKPCSLSKSVESVARCLLDLMTAMVREGFDVNIVRSFTEPIKGMRKVLLDWEKAIESELSYPWDRVTTLVLIAGEIIAEALVNEGLGYTPEVLNMSSTAADMICSRMMEQGSWEEFCEHVKEHYNPVGSQQANAMIAEAVQQLKRTTFFQ